jgi:hypothetical protein
MTTSISNDFAGAIFLLPDASRAAELAETVASNYFPNSEYHFTVTESTPSNIPVDLQEKMSATQRDHGTSTQVLTVYPWALESK